MVSETIKKALNGFILVFLLGNLVIRFSTIFNYPPYNGEIAGFLGAVVAACIFVVFWPRYLRYLLFIFGFSFFLFGFGAIDLQSRIFGLLVTLVATTLLVINWRAPRLNPFQGSPEGEIQQGKGGGEDTPVESLSGFSGRRNSTGQGGQGGRLNRPLVILILCYVGLSLFSLLLLPVTQIFRDLWFFGFPRFFFYLFIGPPYGFYYPAAAVIRLMLFVVLAIQISRTTRAQDNYKWLFSAIFSGAVFCSFIGLLDFYGVISLEWYRLGLTASPGALHSTFGNRGWFGEYILISVPFVLIGFMSKVKGIWWKVMLFGSLILCEIALLLAGGRAGWVSYPVILFVCWLFFWFSKEGRLESFRFSWKDLVKVGISVPITIVISFIIVFQILIPFSDYLRDEAGIKGSGNNSKQTVEYLKSRIMDLEKSDPGGRQYTWGEGVNVGRESPIFGVGYESSCWHANILAGIPGSYYHSFYKGRTIHQTPHNIFVQLFVSGGMVGLFLWLLVVGYALVILIFDLIKEKRLLNTPVIICIMSFHIFGIFQSMQYIPMIWSVIFLCLGYAMTIDDRVLPGRLRRMAGVLTKASVVLMAIGIFFYVSNFESRNLAQKYDMRVYAMEEDRDLFAGFFQHSKRWKYEYGGYRWSGKRAAVHFIDDGGGLTEDAPVERPGTGPDSTRQGRRNAEDILVELEFYCMTPGMEEEPVVVTVSHEGEVLDRIIFGSRKSEVGSRQKEGAGSKEQGAGSKEQGARGKGGSAKLKGKSSKAKGVSVKRRYELRGEQGAGSGERRLDIEVSRTWIPHNHLGNFDRRELGIGVKILK